MGKEPWPLIAVVAGLSSRRGEGPDLLPEAQPVGMTVDDAGSERRGQRTHDGQRLAADVRTFGNLASQGMVLHFMEAHG